MFFFAKELGTNCFTEMYNCILYNFLQTEQISLIIKHFFPQICCQVQFIFCIKTIGSQFTLAPPPENIRNPYGALGTNGLSSSTQQRSHGSHVSLLGVIFKVILHRFGGALVYIVIIFIWFLFVSLSFFIFHLFILKVEIFVSTIFGEL